MKHVVLALSFIITTASFAQEPQPFEGPFLNGEASYSFTEDESHQQVWNGMFKYTETREMPDRGGPNEILLTGNYKDNLKHLAWGVTVKGEKYNETVTGQYLNGKKNGMWIHRIRNEEAGVDIKAIQASFYKNTFRGKFSYRFENAESAAVVKSLSIEGAFDNNGKFDADWNIGYTDMDDQSFTDNLTYQHGVLARRTFTNVTSGEVIEQMDDNARVSSFFQSMARGDSSATVDGVKYGLQHGNTDHKLLKPVLASLTSSQMDQLSNMYVSALPTLIVKNGELDKKNALRNTMSLIDWKETPKGKKEFEEQQRIQAEYDGKITMADKHFELKNYAQALTLYKEASAIKRNETYPRNQVKAAEEMIIVEQKKADLIRKINGRVTLKDGNENMLESEDYYGKKKHLYEASQKAFVYLRRNLLSTHRDTRTNLDRKTYDNIDLSSLESYLGDLDYMLEIQERVKGYANQDDTKELEKELKKLEDPLSIISKLRD